MVTNVDEIELPDFGDGSVLMVGAWRDSLVERHGYPATDLYCELFWLPRLGPSALWMLRRLAATAAAHPAPISVPVTDLSVSLGLSDHIGRNSAVAKTLRRLVAFDAATYSDQIYQVRLALGPLPQRHLAKLPPSLQELHSRWPHHRTVTAARAAS
jgi:hypothetical protein